MQAHLGAFPGAPVRPAQLLRMPPNKTPLPPTRMIPPESLFLRRVVTRFRAVTHRSGFRAGEKLKLLVPHATIIPRPHTTR